MRSRRGELVSWQEGDQSSPWEPGKPSEGAPSAGTCIPDCQPPEPSVVYAPSLWHVVPVARAATPSKHVSRGAAARGHCRPRVRFAGRSGVYSHLSSGSNSKSTSLWIVSFYLSWPTGGVYLKTSE